MHMDFTVFKSIDIGTILTLIIGVGILYGKIVRLETKVCSLMREITDFKKVCRAFNGGDRCRHFSED